MNKRIMKIRIMAWVMLFSMILGIAGGTVVDNMATVRASDKGNNDFAETTWKDYLKYNYFAFYYMCSDRDMDKPEYQKRESVRKDLHNLLFDKGSVVDFKSLTPKLFKVKNNKTLQWASKYNYGTGILQVSINGQKFNVKIYRFPANIKSYGNWDKNKIVPTIKISRYKKINNKTLRIEFSRIKNKYKEIVPKGEKPFTLIINTWKKVDSKAKFIKPKSNKNKTKYYYDFTAKFWQFQASYTVKAPDGTWLNRDKDFYDKRMDSKLMDSKRDCEREQSEYLFSIGEGLGCIDLSLFKKVKKNKWHKAKTEKGWGWGSEAVWVLYDSKHLIFGD